MRPPREWERRASLTMTEKKRTTPLTPPPRDSANMAREGSDENNNKKKKKKTVWKTATYILVWEEGRRDVAWSWGGRHAGRRRGGAPATVVGDFGTARRVGWGVGVAAEVIQDFAVF